MIDPGWISVSFDFGARTAVRSCDQFIRLAGDRRSAGAGAAGTIAQPPFRAARPSTNDARQDGRRSRDFNPILAVAIFLVAGSTVHADLDYGESANFPLDTILAVNLPGIGDSAGFFLDTTLGPALPVFAESDGFSGNFSRLNRGWGDSETFVYTGDGPQTPEDPDLQCQPGRVVPLVGDLLNRLWQWDDSLGRFAPSVDGTITISPQQPTYLLTHGWDGTLDGQMVGQPCWSSAPAMSSLGHAIRRRMPEANLLAWDWKVTANPNTQCDIPRGFLNPDAVLQAFRPSLSLAEAIAIPIVKDALRSAMKTTEEGNKLGTALAKQIDVHGELGSELHLIGKSHGGGVLGRAASAMKALGHPADSLTTLDTPRAICEFMGQCLINSLSGVDPTSVKEGGRVAVFYYPGAATGFGGSVFGTRPSLTNIALNADHVPPFRLGDPFSSCWIAHLWIAGLDGEDCAPSDGWYPASVWDDDAGDGHPLLFDGAGPWQASSVLDVSQFPAGNFEEQDPYHFVEAAAPREGPDDDSTPTLGMSELLSDSFATASSWTGDSALLVFDADPADPANTVILLVENQDACFFKDIAFPLRGLAMTFDYMFQEPRGEEALTVHLGDEVIYYDNAKTTLASGGLISSGLIYTGHVAGTTARLNFVLRTEGEAGGGVILDNLRIYGLYPGDMTGDGRVNGDDIGSFVSTVTSADPARFYLADFDNDGALDSDDTAAFVNALLAR